MGARLPTLVVLGVLALTGCSGDDRDRSGSAPTPSSTPSLTLAPITDADCAALLPDAVFETLRWTPTGPGVDAGPRGCRREAAEGYVEVRDRSGYDEVCATLDRTGGVGPGAAVAWLGAGITACAVEPAGDIGLTKVVVRRTYGARQVSVAVLTRTPQEQVRQAVGLLVGR